MKFKVNDNETISECLARMREAGYMPVKRIEKPVYTEDKAGNIEVLHQDIQFVGKKLE
ncbi:NETI motif-containing protein [Staphylococcus devriesei]|uniref:NETI motif-containing protein n=1 Tax=Staphylococcus devriesei TaxID=586733 RepID=UPI001F16B68C|nr:NETI motif-containing protein [Staphylococcus devriesei]MCE5090971.1 NETI motif-containing protein [Staphylococcus devriesei]